MRPILASLYPLSKTEDGRLAWRLSGQAPPASAGDLGLIP